MFIELITSEPFIWIIIAVIFAIIEAFTMGLTTIWFAIGGVVACIIALMGGSLLIQIIVFFTVSIILLYFTRPLAEKKLKIGHEKNIIEQMLDKTGLVTETIEPYNTGQVKVDGMIWSAVSNDNKDILSKNEIVKIVRIEGVKLVVSRVKGEV